MSEPTSAGGERLQEYMEFLLSYHRRVLKIHQLLIRQLELVNKDTSAMGEEVVNWLLEIEQRIEKIGGASDKQTTQPIANSVAEIIASVQSQDITRQQVEFVCGALASLSQDLTNIATAIDNGEALAQTKTTRQDTLAEQYCMDKQREVHRQVFGDKRAQHDTPPKFQLF